ncbi:putative quinol monooxygenase [Actinomycetospora sp. C-140]
MIVARFRIRCHPEWSDEVARAMAAVEAPSRALPGVVHFDVARSITDPDAFVVVEVFEARDALDRQNSQPEVAEVLRLVGAGAVTADPEWAFWEATPAS